MSKITLISAAAPDDACAVCGSPAAVRSLIAESFPLMTDFPNPHHVTNASALCIEHFVTHRQLYPLTPIRQGDQIIFREPT